MTIDWGELRVEEKWIKDILDLSDQIFEIESLSTRSNAILPLFKTNDIGDKLNQLEQETLNNPLHEDVKKLQERLEKIINTEKEKINPPQAENAPEKEQREILDTMFIGKSKKYDPFNSEDAENNYKALEKVSIEVMLEHSYWATPILKKRTEVDSEKRNFRNELAERPDLLKKYREMKVQEAFREGETEKFNKTLAKFNPEEQKQLEAFSQNIENISALSSANNIPEKSEKPEEPANESTVLFKSMLQNILKKKDSVKFENRENNQICAIYKGKEIDMKKIFQEVEYDKIKFNETDFKHYEKFLGNKDTLMKPMIMKDGMKNMEVKVKLNITRNTPPVIEDITTIKAILDENCKNGTMKTASTSEKLAANVYSTEAHKVINPMFRGDFSGSKGYDVHLMSKPPDSLEKYNDSYILSKDDEKLYYINANKIIIMGIKDFKKFSENIDVINKKGLDKVNLSGEKFNQIITLNGGHARLNSASLGEAMLTGAMFVHCCNTLIKTPNPENKENTFNTNVFRIDKELPQAIVDERMEAVKNKSTTVLPGVTSTSIDRPDPGFYSKLLASSDPSTEKKVCKVATVFTDVDLIDISDVNCYGEKEITMKPNTVVQWNYGAKIGDIYYISGSPTTNLQAPHTINDLGLSMNIDVSDVKILDHFNPEMKQSQQQTAYTDLENEFQKIADQCRDFFNKKFNLDVNIPKPKTNDKPIVTPMPTPTSPNKNSALVKLEEKAHEICSLLEADTAVLNSTASLAKDLSSVCSEIRSFRADNRNPDLQDAIKQVESKIETRLLELRTKVAERINQETGRNVDNTASSNISGTPSYDAQKNPIEIYNALSTLFQGSQEYNLVIPRHSESVDIMKDGDKFASVNSKEIQAHCAVNSDDEYKILIKAALKNYDKPLLIYVSEAEKPKLDKAISELKSEPNSKLTDKDFECTTNRQEYETTQKAKEVASAAKLTPLVNPTPKSQPIPTRLHG